MSRPLLKAIGLCLLAIALSTQYLAVAQVANATLSGTVSDQNGAIVPGVEILIMNPATSLERTATTSGNGSFTIPLLPPGEYIVTAKREGFSPVKISVVLNVGDQKALRIELKAGDVNATVTVDSEAEAVRTDGSVGTVINRNQVANMPLNGRDLHALIQLTPGVVLTPASGGFGATGSSQFSVNGQRATANNFMVDGVSANTGMSVGTAISVGSSGVGTAPGTTVLGGTNSLVSLDALQEFRIETSSYAAEYGRTPGGQISLVTRAGTNEFRGSGSYYFRNEALDANEWFANSRSQPRARERQNLFSGTFSGPLYLPRFGDAGGPAFWNSKNKAFFFLSYEGLRLEQPRFGNPKVPTALLRSQAPAALQPFLNAMPLPNGPTTSPGFAEFDATYSDPASFNIWSLRFDTNVGKTFTSFVHLNHAPSEAQTRAGSLSAINHVKATQDSVTGGWTWIPTSQLTVDVRANWTKNSPHAFNVLDSFGGAIVPDASQIFLPGRDSSNALFVLFGSGFSGFNWGQGTSNVQRQFNVVGTATWLVGPHQLKFGADYRRLLPVIRGGSAPNEQVFLTSSDAIRSGQALFYSISNVDPLERRPIIPNLSLFAQDSWHASQRLTLTYGLRFERVPPIKDGSGQFPRAFLGIENNDVVNPRLAPAGTALWNNRFGEFAPRFGIAYQLSNHRGWETTIRGGGGIFYDLGLGDIIDEFTSAYPFQSSQNYFFLSFPPAPNARVPPPLDGPPTGNFLALDPNLRLPYTIQWNGTWEQALGSKQTITLSYVGALGRRLLLEQTVGTHLADNPTASVNLFIQRSGARSSYDALQAQFQRRFDRRLQVLASYTFGKSQDNSSDEGEQVPPANVSTLLAQEWGASSFDVRHIFTASVTYEIPALSGSAFMKALTRNYGLDLLVRYQSAFPVNISSGLTSTNGYLHAIRPDVVPGQSLYIDDSTVPGGRRINVAAFAAPIGVQGNFPRNGARGFPAEQVDLALRREFKLGERLKLQFRAEFFNLFNTPNFAATDTDWDPSSQTFGQARNTLGKALGGLNALYQMGGPRSGQLALKISF